jgi:integrase
VKLDKGDYIVYKRMKIKNKKDTKAISIKLTPEITSLINDILEYKEPIADYLLPIVTIEKDNSADLHEHITNRRKKYGKYLKQLATEFEMDINLTSYVSRHTMAMQLQSNEIPEGVISQILGHKDLATTKVYLDSLDTSVIDKAAEVL